MANNQNPNPNSNPNPTICSIDPTSGYCSKTSNFYSLRPPSPLPPVSTPLSVTDFIFSLLYSHPLLPSNPALIDASSTSHQISYHHFLRNIKSLASSLLSRFALSKGDCALILSPNSIHIPVLSFSLLSLGVIVSPCNPSATSPEILHHVKISNPVIAFAPSEIGPKIPVLPLGTVLLDSPEFESLMTAAKLPPEPEMEKVKPKVSQSDTAAILYSSGTTGKVKGVELTHRNLISVTAGAMAVRQVRKSAAVVLCTVPFFHVYGLGLMVRTLGMVMRM